MRHYLVSNAAMLDRLNSVELRQLDMQRSSDEKFERIFTFIDGGEEPRQKVFFEGQVFDAFSKLTELVAKAKSRIVLIDGYIGLDTLNILTKKKAGVAVAIYTQKKQGLTNADIEVFNAQHPSLCVYQTKAFHDRFLILDDKTTFHIGASLKDAGKKCFAISLIEDPQTTRMLLDRVSGK